jgi:hypothetical protein
MSTQPNDGGPAFPVPLAFNRNSGEPQHTGMFWDGNGMTLRDYFAAAALTGMLATSLEGYFDEKGVRSPNGRARWAYAHADAMLEERAKGANA